MGCDIEQPRSRCPALEVRSLATQGPAATQLVSQGVDAKLASGDFSGARPDLLVLLQNRHGDLEVQ